MSLILSLLRTHSVLDVSVHAVFLVKLSSTVVTFEVLHSCVGQDMASEITLNNKPLITVLTLVVLLTSVTSSVS